MSVDASQRELLQLIHRHLKEFGFDSAANELQRHNPQGDCSVSASLLDIYSSWLNDPKRKMQSPSLKSPSSKKKGRTPEKVSADSKFKTVNQTKAKNECSSESEELSQSLLPQTPLKLCHATPVRIMASSKPMKEKPAVLVSSLAAIANDCSATTDMPGHVDYTLSATPYLQTPKAVKRKMSGKDSKGSTDKVKAAAKKQAKSPKTKGKGKSKLSPAESAAGIAANKNDKASTKTENAKKKSGPVKRKTPTDKNEAFVSKAKKSKKQMKEVVTSVLGDDSDSDSSLDVEKWKKLVLDMTDADVVKMDVINALDSSSVQPKRRRVRKPVPSKDTKPPGEEQKLVEENNMSNTPAISSSPRKSRTKTPAPMKPPADAHQEESSNSVKDQPAASPVSPSEQNSYGVPFSEEWTKGETPEPKKSKKKRKEANEDKPRKEATKKGGETIERVSCKKPFDETDKANGERKQSENTKHQTLNVQHDEVPDSVVQEEKREKKAKKKKKEKSEQEEDQVSSEQLSEMTSEGTDQILSAKKKKKKIKTNAESSEATLKESKVITVEIPDKNSHIVDKESESNRTNFQDLSEHIFKKKKRKKDKADRETLELADKDNSEIADINGNDHNESALNNDPAPLAPLSPGTPRTEKKKKKSNLQSADATATPQTPGPDSEETSHTEVFFQPPNVIHKKKKKHKKSSSEDV